ncbi:MAG: flavohemoglobin expression-modulating QEGLA motif protein [bacterium]|nr:flavohemoglobin expression-modulating QEGLA motif protein [bacterium]
MPQLSTQEVERLSRAAHLLREAERPVRVIRHLLWPEQAWRNFEAGGMVTPPSVEYPDFDLPPVLGDLAAARKYISGDTPVDGWLQRCATAIETSARMLDATGTPEFFKFSCELYGAPDTPLLDGRSTPLELARRLDEILEGYNRSPVSYGVVPIELSAEEVAQQMELRVKTFFGDAAPPVEVVEHLSGKALAGAKYIRIRRGAHFSDQDLRQLTHHEAYVHIGTTLNGLAQERFPILASAHAGTTRTQEGLAVFEELISGSLDPARFQRLGARATAIDMCINGADFMEIYRFYIERGEMPEEAFDGARRVLRGGPLSGGSPFTKDCTYLQGLLQIHNFLRSAVSAGRIDCLGLLFCGKMDLEDMPALGLLADELLLTPPRYLPPRFADPRFLIAYLAYSAFLNSINLPAIAEYYREFLSRIPVTEVMAGVCYLSAHRPE